MAYRVPAEREKDDDRPAAKTVFCTRCRVAVAETEDGRCPQCLRRSTVARDLGAVGTSLARAASEEPIAALDPGGPDPRHLSPPAREVWPDSETCPICGARDVDASAVFLRVTRTASGFGTAATAEIFARIRTCSRCREHVVATERLRWAALAALLVALPLLVVSPELGHGVGLGIFAVVLAIGALWSVVRRNRALRAVLDASGTTAQVAERVPWPSGLVEIQHWVLHARLPRGRKAIDLGDALGSAEPD